MKNFILHLIFYFAGLSAQGQWIQLNSDTAHDYSSVFFLNPDTGFICGSAINPSTFGYDGVIVRTMDGGSTWDTLHNDFNLMDIFFINDSIGFTGGQDGSVYKTVDMGTTWLFADNIGNNNDYSNLYFTNSDTGLFHDYYGAIILYTPLLFPPSSWIINSPANTWYWGTGALDFTQNIGYFSGGNGVFAKSFDQGMSWNYFNCDSNIFVFDAKMTDSNHIVIVGGTDDSAWGVGENGKSTVSLDGGITWSSPNQFAPHDIAGVDFYDNLHGYSVGGVHSFLYSSLAPVGSIWYTSDGGFNWSLVDSSYDDQISDILIVNDSLAFAVGANGLILKNAIDFNALGIEPESENVNISIYPNPVLDNFKIKIDNLHLKNINVNVFDVTGRLIDKFQISETHSSATISTQTWDNGIYSIKLQIGDTFVTKKIVKIM